MGNRPSTVWAFSGLAAVLALAAVPSHLAGRPYFALSLVAGAVWLGAAAVLSANPAARRLLPALIPLGLATALALLGSSDHGATRAAAWGDPLFADRVAALATVSVIVLVALAAGVDVECLIVRGAQRIGQIIGVVGAAAVFAGLVLPAWAWSRLARRDPLRGGRRRDHRGGWTDLTTARSTPHFGPGRRSRVGRLAWAVGSVALVLGTNYGVGWAWDRSMDSRPDLLAPTPPAGPVPAFETERDPRTDSPAMAAYPWRETYFREIQGMPVTYWPFTETRPEDYRSTYVNQLGWTRAGYKPTGASDRPRVWMFGGSTTWGEGQRDGYTIASYLARIAEDEGLSITVENYGLRGWTHFQEMLLFEQQLALRRPPDLAIFYDGANELTTQSLMTQPVPVHTLAIAYAQRLGVGRLSTEVVSKEAPTPGWGAFVAAYQRHSAVNKVFDWLAGTPAGAAPAQTEPPTTDAPSTEGFETDLAVKPDGTIDDYQIALQDGLDAGKVYERGKKLTLAISADHGVEPFLFWQPWPNSPDAYQLAKDQLTPSTIDISDALDAVGPESEETVYIDGAHTNEEGARLVAVRIWAEIRPSVAAWYEREAG